MGVAKVDAGEHQQTPLVRAKNTALGKKRTRNPFVLRALYAHLLKAPRQPHIIGDRRFVPGPDADAEKQRSIGQWVYIARYIYALVSGGPRRSAIEDRRAKGIAPIVRPGNDGIHVVSARIGVRIMAAAVNRDIDEEDAIDNGDRGLVTPHEFSDVPTSPPTLATVRRSIEHHVRCKRAARRSDVLRGEKLLAVRVGHKHHQLTVGQKPYMRFEIVAPGQPGNRRRQRGWKIFGLNDRQFAGV